jgi:nicotinamide mononucleotide (NMN) deamidase PncC
VRFSGWRIYSQYSRVARVRRLLRSAPGVGKVLSSTLVAQLPELVCSTESRSPRWLVWHHITAIVGACAAAVLSGVNAPRSASCMAAVTGIRGNPTTTAETMILCYIGSRAEYKEHAAYFNFEGAFAHCSVNRA